MKASTLTPLNTVQSEATSSSADRPKGATQLTTHAWTTGAAPTSYDLVCFSHLRWDFVFQRPQHLLSRFAKGQRVFFIEEPIFEAAASPRLELSRRGPKLYVAVPHLPEGLDEAETVAAQRSLVDGLFADFGVHNYVLWYYTPIALPFSRHLRPLATVYDCMDELSAFKGAPTTLGLCEQELLAHTDLVFTGGQSLFEAKRDQHPHVYAFPSSIDMAHFVQARGALETPPDQAVIPGPRLGFYGVLDERLDLDLVAGLADARPDWQLVMVGPIVKIELETLPHRPNIHYLGGKSYGELPHYLAGWDAALLPFAHNASTRFISPTKTPEYLAAGKPVVSTSIRDVVRPYGQRGLVAIADTVETFVAALASALSHSDRQSWLLEVDTFLAQTSWDRTWTEMTRHIEKVIEEKQLPETASNSPLRQESFGND